MRRVLSMVVVTLLVLGATGSAAAAKVLRAGISGTQQVIDVDLSEARVWQAGPVEHVRGLRITLVQQDSAYGEGSALVVANQRIDTRTGSGNGWGTFRTDHGDGGFDGTFHGTVDGGTATWHVVAHGWGDQRGELRRGTVIEDLATGSSSYTGTSQITPRR
jgi:hypothetical protein